MVGLGRGRLQPGLAGALAMLALGLWRLGSPDVWADELATVGAARMPLADLLHMVRHVDAVIFPFYAVMHAWVDVTGTGPFSLRLPSVLLAAAAAGLTADIARRLWGPKAGLAAAVLVVAVPNMSRFGQEARPYAAGIAGTVLAAWCVVRRLEEEADGRTRCRWDVVACLAILFAVAMQPMTVFAVPALAVWRMGATGWRTWWVSAAVAAAPGSLLLVFGRLSQASVWSWVLVLPFDQLPYRAAIVIGSREVAGALFILALAALRPRRPELALALWAFAPILVLLLLGTIEPVYIARLLVFTIPALCILAAGLLARLDRIPVAVVLVAVVLLGWPGQVEIRQPDGHSQATSQVRTVIAPRFEPGDVAVYGDNHRSIPWSPRDMVAYYLPPDRTPADALVVRPQRSGGHFLAVESKDIAGRLANAERIWVVRVESPADPRAGLGAPKSAYLAAHYRVAQTWRFKLVTIALLMRR